MIATPTEIAYFIEAYQVRHFSKAAIRIGITQPALTQCIQKLEQKLSTPLFYRSKQGVVPTAEGTVFYKKARWLADAWRDVARGVRDQKNEMQGHYKLGCHPSVGSYTLPPLFEKMNQVAPGVGIELFHENSRAVLEKIISYEIDLGFVVNPFRHPDLVLKKIGEDRMQFWKRKGLVKVPKRLFVDTHLAQASGSAGKLHRKSFKDWELVNSTSLELIRSLTLSGQGVGLLPERIALADNEDLSAFERQLPRYKDEIFLAYRKDAIKSQGAKELVRWAGALLAK